MVRHLGQQIKIIGCKATLTLVEALHDANHVPRHGPHGHTGNAACDKSRAFIN